MSDDVEEIATPDPPKPEDDDADDALELLQGVQDVGGKKVVGLDQLIEHRKASKAQRKEIAALKAQVEEYKGIDERLQKVLPIAEAVEKHPELGKQIRAVLDGTRQTRPTTEQPDDAEALEYAQVLGLVTKDKDGNDVYDVARAQRALEIEGARAEKRVRPHIDAAHSAALSMRGEQNLTAMYNLTTKAGEPLATEQSIREILKESGTPVEMLANPQVAKSIAMFAAGRDREEGRTPKAPIEPLYFERAGGRRGESSQISEFDKRIASKVGLVDADLAAVGKMKVTRKGETDLE